MIMIYYIVILYIISNYINVNVNINIILNHISFISLNYIINYIISFYWWLWLWQISYWMAWYVHGPYLYHRITVFSHRTKPSILGGTSPSRICTASRMAWSAGDLASIMQHHNIDRHACRPGGGSHLDSRKIRWVSVFQPLLFSLVSENAMPEKRRLHLSADERLESDTGTKKV